jgi:glutaminyl-tRNA synthetase
MYDWAHGQSDAIEGVTHSICTLEFVNHRPLYHWYLDALKLDCHPQQIEFARLNLTYTVLSKRRLQELVEGGHVAGWDDPRMPTLAGMRRRGYTPAAIRNFCERIGVSTRDSLVDVSLLEHALREDLNATRCPSRASSTSNATTSPKTLPRSGFGWPQARRCASGTPASFDAKRS